MMNNKNKENMVDKLAKLIMSYKKTIGEFSMDLYYNDIANERECFVAKFMPMGGDAIHFRGESFMDALLMVLHHITKNITHD